MEKFKQLLEHYGFSGEIDESEDVLNFYSHDASMFELKPKIAVFPKDSKDVGSIVSAAREAKKMTRQHIYVTPRSAGTDMSGAAISHSVIMDMTKYFNQIFEVSDKSAHVQPGVHYRDLEPETLKYGALLPSFPASRDLCTVGGMVANNSGGEKSLEFGKTEKYVTELKVVFADGNEYTVKPLNKAELEAKIAQNDYEGTIYKRIYELCEEHYDEIKAAKPNVSKDSTAYHLWNVWDRETGIFDLNQIIIGSQGTLGVVTDIRFKLVPAPKHSGTLVMFLRDINQLGEIINTVMKHKPATFEGFDDYTLKLSFKLFFSFRKTIGLFETIKLAIQLIPTAFKLLGGIPKMVLLVEFNADNTQEIRQRIIKLQKDLRSFKRVSFENDYTEAKAKKFWMMRRESFNLLRKKVKDKHTAPFIDDLVVPPEHLVEFLPKLRDIMDDYELQATIAGHMGDGNFHVIPLMKIEKTLERIKLAPAMREVNNLVLSYGGSLSGEHNDGMSRGPWLHLMYSRNMMKIFKKVKNIFDPDNILNADKKTDSHWEFSMTHLRKHF